MKILDIIQNKLTQIGALDPPADGKLGPVTRWALGEIIDDMDFSGDFVFTDALAKRIMAVEPWPITLGNDLASRIVKAMQARSAWLCRHPDCFNIVYVEAMEGDGTPNGDRPNCFDGRRLLIQFDDHGVPLITDSWEATTEASKHWTDHPMNPGGAARITLGQQKAWAPGHYHGPALVQVEPITITRDPQKTYKRYGRTFTGLFGIHHHQGYNYPRNDEGLSSAGCNIGRTTAGHLEFMRLVMTDARHVASSAYRFMSTVIRSSELPAK